MPRLGRVAFSLAALPYDLLTAQDVWREHCRALVARFPRQAEPWRVLDLGCGPANSPLAIAGAGARWVVGLDLARGMLRRGQRALRRGGRDAERVSLVLANAEHLPLADGTFDAVTGHSFLYLVPSPATVLAEVRRVLRPGGVLVLLEPSAGLPGLDLVPLLARSARFAISMAGWRIASSQHRRFSHEHLAETLARAGFTDVLVERTLGGLGLLASATSLNG